MTGLTTWERWKAGLPARDKDERDRYREYDAARTGVTEIDPSLSRKDGPLQVLSSKPKPERSAA
jgi:hypothetical protein